MTIIFFTLRLFAILAVCLYVAASAFLYFNQAQYLFPGAFMPFPPELEGFGEQSGLQQAQIKASDGETLFAFHHPPMEGKPIVIVFHGNASYPEAYGFLYGDWIASGYGIVAPAARGYPRSSGAPEGEKMLADALDIYDWAAKHYTGHPVFVFGQSLGTSPAIHLAAHRKVEGVVLISPFKSMLSLAQNKLGYFPVWLLLRSPFRSDLDIEKVTAPILILHGDRDELIPITSAQELAAAAKTKVAFETVGGAGHNSGLFAPDMIDRINRFIGIGGQSAEIR
jgi:pimeloyl-ACP methyl ester carboxylesterase